MPNLPNYVVVPSIVDAAGTSNKAPDGASVFRAPTPQPLFSGGGGAPAAPVGPQLWPLKL